MANNIGRQSQSKEEDINDNTILEKVDNVGWHESKYDWRINIKSFRLERKSKEETIAHARV